MAEKAGSCPRLCTSPSDSPSTNRHRMVFTSKAGRCIPDSHHVPPPTRQVRQIHCQARYPQATAHRQEGRACLSTSAPRPVHPAQGVSPRRRVLSKHANLTALPRFAGSGEIKAADIPKQIRGEALLDCLDTDQPSGSPEGRRQACQALDPGDGPEEGIEGDGRADRESPRASRPGHLLAHGGRDGRPGSVNCPACPWRGSDSLKTALFPNI
jgi:hypothetical protein